MKIALAALMLALSSCATALSTAQNILTPFSFHVEGEAQGVVAMNSTYLAVDASVDLVATYRAPRSIGGKPVAVWTKEFRRDAGQRAYRVVFSGVDGESFVQIVRVPWEEARRELPFLPEAKPEVDYAPEESIVVPVATPGA